MILIGIELVDCSMQNLVGFGFILCLIALCTCRAAAALMMGEDMHKFGRSRLERNDFSMNGGAGMVNPASRQIYLTFPADSTFREEDVSNYFRFHWVCCLYDILKLVECSSVVTELC